MDLLTLLTFLIRKRREHTFFCIFTLISKALGHSYSFNNKNYTNAIFIWVPNHHIWKALTNFWIFAIKKINMWFLVDDIFLLNHVSLGRLLSTCSQSYFLILIFKMQTIDILKLVLKSLQYTYFIHTTFIMETRYFLITFTNNHLIQ